MASCAGWSEDNGLNNVQGCTTDRQLNGKVIRAHLSIGGPFGPARTDASGGGVNEEYLKATMEELAQRLSVPNMRGWLGLPVVDRTGIGGVWDFALDRTCLTSDCEIYARALEKIGLGLEKTAAPVERLAIDQIDAVPTEN